MKKTSPRTLRLSLRPLALLGLAVLAGSAMAAERSGKDVVDAYCAACHASGKDGAPKIGNAADWSPRAAHGLEKLSRNAITGVRKMPAHGGQASLTDLEMTRAIAYMISGGKTPDPQRPYGTHVSASGDSIVADTCGACHQEGRNGAPRIGDIDAWKPRLKGGVDRLVASAINGHAGMPARGGMVNLSDADIRAAVSAMVSKVSKAPAPGK